MNRRKKFIAVVASALMFSFFGAGQAQAAEVLISGSTDWISDDEFGDYPGAQGRVGGLQTANSYRLSGNYNVDITDYQSPIDRFTLFINNVLVGTTGPKDEEAFFADTVEEGWDNPGFSKGTFAVSSGLLTILTAEDSATWGNYGIRFNFLSADTRGNALRLDAAGTTTEKNNVVSCTPGKYTFLNGGSTPEASNIQSYVYTLLVNGKAVSTLSSDDFRSVASHLFPTIAGNMAGTATLEGATWDLKGMSNYSAACQVYATQSSGNIQSVTTEVHDAVALAAAAEAAAKVQMAKDMIADWAASNDELAKKYRDQRLVAQP